MNVVIGLIETIGSFFAGIFEAIGFVFSSEDGMMQGFTTIARWVFIALALYVVLKSAISLLKSSSPSEIWAYLNIEDKINLPIRHWENLIGRGRSSDIEVPDPSVSRSHGILARDNTGIWRYMDLGSKNGALVDGERAPAYEAVPLEAGSIIRLGRANCTLFPVSLEERMSNVRLRKDYTRLLSPWGCMIAITVFQIMAVIQLYFGLGERFVTGIAISYGGLILVMWIYVFVMRRMKRQGFEIELLAFFLSGISLAAEATRFPDQVLKQFIAILLGLILFVFMCTILRDLERTRQLKKYLYIAAALLLLFNLIFGEERNGARNWVAIFGMTIQPSELVKLAFIWVGAASMDEIFRKRSSLEFTVFSLFCFICLALMGDFGTAIIFFVTYVVISFLRSGDFSRMFMILGVAFVGGLMVIRFKSYVAARFGVWGHSWDPEHVNNMGYQMTRTMSASASGGLVGVGAGKGWLHTVWASETDLVFGLVSEEWGLIIAVLAVLAIIALSVFAFRSIYAGRSTYYTIAACAATTLFLFQTILNVFGSVDLLPLTGVTFPFVSAGGSSMLSSWGMLAFLKAADNRQNASLAVSLKEEGLEDAV